MSEESRIEQQRVEGAEAAGANPDATPETPDNPNPATEGEERPDVVTDTPGDGDGDPA